MPDVANLLPSNATDLEKALTIADGNRIEGLNADVIKTLWSPWDCPASMIPYLAWAYGVDIWDETWQETTKRQVIADIVRLKRHKGTPYAIKAYPSYFGATVLKIIRPPARGYHRAAVTPDAWATWLASMPQVRIFPFANFGLVVHTGKQFPRRFHSNAVHRTFGNADFHQTSRGTQLYGRNAFLFTDGGQTEIGLEPVEEGGRVFDRVYLTATGSKRGFHGHGYVRANKRFHQTSTADLRTLTIQLNHNGNDFPTLLASSMRPIDTFPHRVMQARTRPAYRRFHKRGEWRKFSLASYGPLLVYDRIALLDPTKAVRRRKVRGFHGHKRFGIDPYTAQITVDIPLHRPRSRLNKFHVGFVKKADMSKLWKVIGAIGRAKSFRDTILIDTVVYRSVALKDGLPLGSYTLGQIIKVA